ncbi:hypothetical protein [Rhodococcoides yunnanense]|uniref:hypothetical protein n=1 Tax=Rhodococcoides yunnanense TaxID=278209 RepID=UPI0009323D72|nr:hypothetical protein [Rhodococcus yunnanensis]
MTAPAASLRGGAVGALVVATAVAAHGFAGGGYPAGSSLVFLLVVAAGIGALLAGPRPADHRAHLTLLFGGLALGQSAAHVALVVGSPHEMAHAHSFVPSASMMVFHLFAVAAGGILVYASERLYGPITRVVRAVLSPPLPLPDASAPGRIDTASPQRFPLRVFTTSLSRRGPPAVWI